MLPSPLKIKESQKSVTYNMSATSGWHQLERPRDIFDPQGVTKKTPIEIHAEILKGRLAK